MVFVEHHGLDSGKMGVAQNSLPEGSIGLKQQARFRAGNVFKTNLIAHGFSKGFSDFLGDARRQRTCGDAARLQDQYLTRSTQEKTRDLRGFPVPGGADRMSAPDCARPVSMRARAAKTGSDSSLGFSF